MRRRMLRMWLGLALRAMERAASYSAELLADRHLDDLALAYRILYRAVTMMIGGAYAQAALYAYSVGGGDVYFQTASS